MSNGSENKEKTAQVDNYKLTTADCKVSHLNL